MLDRITGPEQDLPFASVDGNLLLFIPPWVTGRTTIVHDGWCRLEPERYTLPWVRTNSDGEDRPQVAASILEFFVRNG